MRRWHAAGRRTEPDAIPNRDLEAYDGSAQTPSVRQLQRVVNYYFRDAKRRDLVVVPPPNFVGEAVIGEFLDDPGDVSPYRSQVYPGEDLLGRRVSWLGRIAKNRLPGNILDALNKPGAITQIPESFLSIIYQIAYGSYVSNDRYIAEFQVDSAKYSIADDIYLIGFFKFVAYNYREIAQGSRNIESLDRAAFLDVGDYAPDLTADINSPGNLTLSSQYLVPLVASVMFSLAVVVGPAAVAQAQNGTLTVGNSKGPPMIPVCSL